ncbi:MAG: hypothetical protein PT939_04960 [Aerococcus suis]|nr:hypothetical protein [Aerococcus suis]
MVKVEIKKNYIPVEIGDLKYKFMMTDENYNKLNEFAKTVEKTEGDDIETVKEVVSKALDVILEDGAGEEIYQACGNSAVVFYSVYLELAKEISLEVMDEFKDNATQLEEVENKQKELTGK